MQPNYYKILQVDPAAAPEIIDAAYRRLAQAYHPDKHGGSEESAVQMAEINAAYAVLRNPVERRIYDIKLEDESLKADGDGRWLRLYWRLALTLSGVLLLSTAVYLLWPEPEQPSPPDANATKIAQVSAIQDGVRATREANAPTATPTPNPGVILATAPPATSTQPAATESAAATPTSMTTAVPTVAPTTTATEAPTSTPEPTSTPTATVAPTATRTPTVEPQFPRVLTLNPTNGFSGGGLQTFVWQSDATPPRGQGFELIFWRAGDDPFDDGFGPAPIVRQNAVTIDLDQVGAELGDRFEPGSYKWGVLLVDVEPYRRITFLGGGSDFTFEPTAEQSATAGAANSAP